MMDSLTELTRNAIERFTAEKERVIKERIISLGYSHLIDGMEKRRFSKILIEKKPHEETVWIDNNTDEGLRVITFITPNYVDMINNRDLKFSIKQYYY